MKGFPSSNNGDLGFLGYFSISVVKTLKEYI